MSTVDFLIHLRGLGVNLHAEGERLICSAPSTGTLTADLRSRIAERKAEILAFLRQARTAGQPDAAPILPVPRGAEPLPASFAQRRLWFLDQLAPGNPFYGMPGYFRLTGRLDAAALERSLTEVARRHESLRTTFAAVDSEPVQVIAPPAPVPLPRADLSALPEAARQDEVRRIARAEGERPFNLARGPLLRALLLLAGEQEAVLYLNTHHIVSDGWSVGVLNGELAALYPAFAAGLPSPLPPLPVQYAEFAAWQRRHLSGERLDDLVAYWRRRLTGLPPLQLAADHPRPEVQSYRGAGVEHWLPPDLAASLRRLAQDRGATLFMVLLAGFQALLHRVSGQDDFAVGSPIANRNRREVEGLIGFFVNMLVLRARAGAETPFRELVDRVQETTLEAYAHQDLPFERLVEELAPERSTSHSPLFQVAFALQNAPGGLLRLGDLTLELADFGLRTTRFDLELHFWEDPRGLYGLFLYDADLFDEPTVRRLGRHFQTLLEGAVAHPGARLSELPLLGEAEQHQILVEWNDRRAGYPRDGTIHGLFARAARRWPEAVAVEYGERTLTYAALEQRANALARMLVRHGAGAEVPVAVLAERGPDLIVALLAILQAGGAYLPLDPAFPPARLAWMLDDAGAAVLLAGRSFAATVRSLPPHRATVLDLEETLAAAGEAGAPPAGHAAAEQLAYVIYTSGSTGRPKGVAVPHRAVLRLVLGSDYVRLGPGDRVAQASTAAFDAATFEIWGALLNGARLIGLPREILLSAPDLAAEIRRRRIQTLFLTTALFHQLTLQQGDLFAPLRELLFGGETADPAAVRRVLAAGPPERLLHVYGPTESTTFATWHPVTEPPGAAAPPIGRPIADTHLRVLDPELRPVPAGVAGELCLGGDGLARGYLGRPDLTAERFVPDPWGEPGARLYRTGDLARLRPDGAVEHLGRLDHQVKLRGFRIELGEIEAALLQHPSVTSAVALVREDAPGDRRLTAYVVPSPQTPTAETAEETAMSHGSEQVERWSAVFDEHVYREADLGDGDPTFNIAGWKSTFTGEPLGAAAMRAWLDDRIERIQTLAPRRLLEIGCGTGMLLFRLAPGCASYLGTDVSRASLGYVERLLAERPLPSSSARVELRRQAADDFAGVAPESLDAVLLNSVVQYFPSLDYLLEVLEKAFAALAPGGFVFLGDLRSRPLLETFHTALELYRAEPAALRRTLADRARLGRLRENELAVDPALFAALRERLPRLGGVEIHLQRGAHRNELTRFRYDVILHAAPAPAVPEGSWLEWEREGLGLDALRRHLERDRPAFLGVTGIPNARLDEERAALAWLSGGEGPRTAGELRRRLSGGATTAGGGVDPEALLGLAADLGYRAAAGWSGSGAEGRFDAVFVREPAEVRPGTLLPLGRSDGARRPWSAYANEPLWGRRSRLLVPALRRHLEERLPEFMLPAAIVVLDRLPLTVNGKIDRAALPAPDGPGAARSGPPPRTALEKSIAEVWGEVLKVDRVSLEDNFFDLGGHSLLVAQVTDRLTRTLGRKVAVVEMFEHPTVRALARHLSPDKEAPEEEPRSLAAPRAVAATAAADEPIAVIALAGRFPGAQDVEALWRNLCDGVESIAHFSEEELLASGVPRELIHLPGYVAAAGALAGIELFDAHFFGYNPREAETLDPQHRLVLECAWEALERAGHDPAGFPGRIGVWAGAGGIGTQIYALTHLAANPALLREVSPLQLVLGNERDFLATRVSYKLNLKGPSLTVQTACSTSLVATHLACEALRRGACDMALAGGVTVQVPQHAGYVYQPGMLLSPDGHCRAFDVDARGSISGNGAGLVVLRRLRDALADGDPIHAVIRGSAVNNDGAVKVGFTAPGIEGQAQVIADALAAAGVEPEEIGYVEAHGTGTELGDPIEVAALTRAFRTRTDKKGFCSLGSVKSNIGHLGAAAGVAGLIKACLALENRFIPPTLHVTEPNPGIPFAESPFRVATEGVVWENGSGPRRAGVSSFGLGGTNAHVVLEEAPAVEPSGPSRSWQLLTLSARGPAALDRATEELTRHLLAHPDLDLADVAFTLRVGRRAFEHRRMLVARDLPDAVAALQSRDPGRVLTEAVEPGDRSLAFLFPEVPDWPAGLGAELYRGEPTFRAEIDRCAAGFLPLVGADLRPLFAAPTASAGAPPKSLQRAALFAFELALARLWMEWGLSPATFLGHGVGEAVAACLSGALPFDDALAEAVALPSAPPPAEDGRLTAALRELAADPERVLLEVGPGDALTSLAHRRHNGAGAIAIASLPAGLEGDETRALLSVLGLLWCVGLDIDGRGLHRHERRRRVLLPTYRFERQRFWVEPGGRTPATAEKQEDLAIWFHRPVWTREAPPATVPGDDGAWLLFLDETGLGSRLAARLAAQGREVIAVRAGAGFAQTEGAFTVRPAHRGDHEALFRALGSGRVRRVVHLWSYTEEEASAHSLLDLGFHSLLALAQAHGDAGGGTPLRIEIVSSDMQAVDGREPLAPEKATLLGPCRVLPQERREIACRSLDLTRSSGATAEELVDALLAELAGAAEPPVVAWRHGARWVPSFEPVRLEGDGDGAVLREGGLPLLPGGVYLITGGFGGMGLTLAEHLSRTLGARLALVGRRPRALPALEAAGAEVLPLAADVADRDAMEAAVRSTLERFGRLDGVFHAAGLPGAGIVQSKERSVAEAVLAPKVAGTRVLDEVLRSIGAEPDFVVLCSSLVAVFGGFGQVDYCAANAFLDAFAHLRRPWRTVSINWDSWREVGMAAGAAVPEDLREHVERALALAMTPAEGVEVVRRTLASPLRRALISTYDLKRRAAGLVEPAPAAPVRRAARRYKRPSLPTPFVPPRTPLEEGLAALWQEVLGIEEVGVHDDFFQLGGHSLLGAQLASRVRDAHGLELRMPDLFASPTVAALAELLSAAPGDAAPAGPPLARVPREGPLPLSFAQQRLWFLDQLVPGNAFYNVPSFLRLRGLLDLNALGRALDAVVRRHEALRTTFPLAGGAPVQAIHPAAAVPLPVVDLGGLPEELREAAARGLVQAEAERPFDLEAGPLLRARLLRHGTAEHTLLLTLHHIVTDGWSMGVLHHELSVLYDGGTLPELVVQYADFAAWQRSRLHGEILEAEIAHWRARLGDEAPPLRLPLDRPRSAARIFRGARSTVALPARVADAFRALGQERGATLSMTLLAAFAALLHRVTGAEDVTAGSPHAGRDRTEIEGLIGFFVNMLVLRMDAAGDPPFTELLGRVQRTALAAYAHQEVPFDKLVEELRPDRALSRNPLFDVVFALQNVPLEEPRLRGLEVATVDSGLGATRFDLEMHVWETPAGLLGVLYFDANLFDATTVTRLGEHFRHLLEGIAAEPDARLSRLPLLGEAERHQVATEWNDTAPAHPPHSRVNPTIHGLFAAQAARTPDATALLFGEERLSYAGLDARAEALAGRLRALGLAPETPVAVFLERSPGLIVALLAVLQAGGCYLALDPEHPAERLRRVLENANAPFVITETRLAGRLPDGGARPVFLDETGGGSSSPASWSGPGHLAYVSYTSGSTGRPKGVCVEHRSVVRLVRDNRFLSIGPGDVVLHHSPVAFDASTLEIWGPLLNGGCLALCPPGRLSPRELAEVARASGTTVLWLTAGLFHALEPGDLALLGGVRHLLAGGDALAPDAVARALAALPSTRLINGYGPTENTTFTSCHVFSRDAGDAPVLVGRPIGATRVHVLDRHLQALPIGAWGELCAAGDGLARGYLGRPERTAASWVPDPAAVEPGGRLYRTGDLARFRADGTLELLGRIDRQVKIRGFRVEPGEVEAALAAHPAVREAVVLAYEPAPGDRRLAAWVTLRALAAETELRAHCAALLPEAMVPARIVALERMPLTAQGKIDRRALPAPDGAAGAGTPYVAPRTPLEERIVALWAEVLRVERVGVHDDFFALGGHSLLATQLVSRLRDGFQVELPLRCLFEAPTPEKLAGIVEVFSSVRAARTAGAAATEPGREVVDF